MKNHLVTALMLKSFSRSLRLIAALLIVASSAMVTAAQDNVPKRGFNPGGSYALSDIESINTSNGNLSFRVPLGSLPAGRAGLATSLGLVYNSKLYDSFVAANP